MDRSQLKKLVLVATMGILFLGFVPAVQAKTTKRPIEEWLKPDPDWSLTWNNHSLGWIDDTDLVIWPHFKYPRNIWGGIQQVTPIWSLPHSGYVLERELKDDMLLITIYLKVNDVPFHMTRWAPLGPLLFEGIMHYTFKWNMIIDLTAYPLIFDGEIAYAPLILYINPYAWPDLYNSVVEIGVVHFNGAGTGEFKTSYPGWEEGDTAKVKVNMVGLVKDFDPDKHPVMEPWGFWPVEFIFYH